MTVQFTPPPTYAAVVLYDENAPDVKALLRSVRFNPIWLRWFIDVAQFITQSGGGGGGGPVTDVTASSPLASSGGPTPNITISGAALTRTNDTNVTLTLGGTPATALLVATSLALGWSGTLSTARGGTGNGSGTATAVAVGGITGLGTGVGTALAINVGSAGSVALATRGTYTGTGTGFTAPPTATFKYTLIDNGVILDLGNVSGTSNATTFTVTGAPAAIRPAASKTFPVFVQDNGGSSVSGQGTMDSSGVITLFLTPAGGGFTNSGTKTLNNSSVSYTLA